MKCYLELHEKRAGVGEKVDVDVGAGEGVDVDVGVRMIKRETQ